MRGLDYYTRTVFEFTSDALGAQSGVGGGGRYDLLAEQLGGPHAPGIGFGRRGRADRPVPAPSRRRAGDRRVPRRTRASADAGARVRAAHRAARTTALSARWSRPGARSRASSSRRTASARGATVIAAAARGAMRDMRSGEQQTVATVDEVLQAFAEMRKPCENCYRDNWAGELRPATSTRPCAWPAGCTAAATTAG